MSQAEAETLSTELPSSEDPRTAVRRNLLRTTVATLCTTSVKAGVAGFPFGSVVPFALTSQGMPVILVARIAAHTHNLAADDRASLFVRQPGIEGDPQKGWRITVMGHWRRIRHDDPERPWLHARYLRRVPWAEGYQQTHDFDYWRMEQVARVRYIGGFGQIHWLDGDTIARDPGGQGIAQAAPGTIDHMNIDHVDNLREMCRGLYDLDPEGVEMCRLEGDGFFVQTTGPDRLLYFPFGEDVDASGLRLAVIDVLKRARGAMGDGARSQDPDTPHK